MWTMNFQMFKLVLEKAEESEIKYANICWIMEKAREFQKKTSICALLTMPKPLTVWITINCGKSWKRWEYQFFTIEDNVCCGFVIYSFYYIEVCSFYSCFLEGFYHRWILNFVKGFLSASIEVIIWFLFFNLLMWCITLIDLQILKHPCIPGIKPTWLWCMIFLICCWILFARILLRIFASMLISDIGL